MKRPAAADAMSDGDSRGRSSWKGGGKRGGKPSRERGFTCPVMTAEEAKKLTVPFAEIEKRLREVLDTQGAAIVTGVASPEDCAELEALFSEDLAELLDDNVFGTSSAAFASAAMASAEPRSWPLASLKALGVMERCQLRGLPHGRFAWGARLLPRVKQVYALLHGTDDLVSSCDNSFFAPQGHPQSGSNRNWPHVDQNKHDRSAYDDEGVPLGDWRVFQGLLYVWDATSRHASTTVVWPGSHLDVYEEIMSNEVMLKRGRKGNHFSPLANLQAGPGSELSSNQWAVAARRLPVPAGSLLLWNSKTTHQGWSGGPRLAQPVCWEPAGRRTEKSRARKLWMAALGLPSTHWASLGIPHMMVKPELAAPVEAGGKPGNAVLPLRPTIRPVTLVEGAGALKMWEDLSKVDPKFIPEDVKGLLERSILPKYLAVL